MQQAAHARRISALAEECGHEDFGTVNKLVRMHARRMIEQDGVTEEELDLARELGIADYSDAELHAISILH